MERMKYTVCFKATDGKMMRIPAQTREDAEKVYNDLVRRYIRNHFDDLKFAAERIAIFNAETRYVELITDVDLKEGKVSEFREGDIVRFVDKWCKPEELKLRFKVTNMHEEFGTCTIILVNYVTGLGHSENVRLEMIRPATLCDEEEKEI